MAVMGAFYCAGIFISLGTKIKSPEVILLTSSKYNI
jgi:hypothetical protein